MAGPACCCSDPHDCDMWGGEVQKGIYEERETQHRAARAVRDTGTQSFSALWHLACLLIQVHSARISEAPEAAAGAR